MQRILLTGASSGIGREVYNKLKIKYDVYAPSSNELNLSDSDSINQIDYSKFDTVINCAGINRGTYQGFEINSDGNQLEQILVNYYGPLIMLKNFLKCRSSGTFCYISSYSIIEPKSYNIVNASCKSALKFAVDTLRKEYPQFQFVEMMPGKTKTNMLYTNYQGTKTPQEVDDEYNTATFLHANDVADKFIYAINEKLDQVVIKGK
jgi:short-subunit dehydrogenase